MSDFKDLDVWQKAIDVVVSIYQVTSKFPESEKFGLVNQLRRAAVSIPSNIAEGSARHHSKDFIHFFRIADGSAAEVETQLIIANKLGYIESEKSQTHELVIIRKMLAGLIKSLR